MRNLIYNSLLISCLIISFTSQAVHPIKLTASLIEYRPETKSIRMECRVFIDDFEQSVSKINEDFLWAASNNPFGHFSNKQHLSFPQYDAAAHNTIFTEVNLTMSALRSIFQQFKDYNMSPKEALAHTNYIQLRHRWNMLVYKIERASKYLSMHDYKHALFFVHSTRADVRYIKNVVFRAAAGVEVEMTCSGLYSFKEVLLMGPKLGAFWLFLIIFGLIYSFYNCYRSATSHFSKVMSPDKDSERQDVEHDRRFVRNLNRYMVLNNMDFDDLDDFLRPTRRIDMML